jgi:hypothetical protein
MTTKIVDTSEIETLSKILGTGAIDLASIALTVGWEVKYSNHGNGLLLIAPGGLKTINLSSKHKGSGDYRGMTRTIIRYGDQDVVKRLRMAASDSTMSNARFSEVLSIAGLTASVLEVTPIKSVPAPKGAFGQEQVLVTPETTVKTAPVQISAPKPVPRHIVSQRPALMHYSLTQTGGKSYPSKTSVERKWSDGTIDYQCAVSTCDGTSTNRRSFAGPHWAMHVRKGEAEPVPESAAKETIIDDPSYTEHGFTKISNGRKSNAASQRIADLLGSIELWREMTSEELAERLAAALFPKDVPIDVEYMPLTADQIVARIRRMVDGGTYAEQEAVIETERTRIEELVAEVKTITTSYADDMATALGRAERAEGNLRAFHSLLGEAIIEETKDAPIVAG